MLREVHDVLALRQVVDRLPEIEAVIVESGLVANDLDGVVLVLTLAKIIAQPIEALGMIGR
jgi:hypothetical protein